MQFRLFCSSQSSSTLEWDCRSISIIAPSLSGQQRGRLFLPFADDDPRTAEVISKVLLLARDTDIRDPTILEQLLAA